MTKKIDPNYLLDELNLQGDIIRRMAKLLGYPREPIAAGLLAAPRVTSQDHEVLEALLSEMDERRMTRLRVEPHYVPPPTPDDVDKIDDLLDVLRRLPTRNDMAAILSAHEIGKEARKRQIEKNLLHVAVVSGPRGVNLKAMLSSLAGREVSSLDELTEEEMERYYDSWMPRLPDGLRQEWEAFVGSVQAKWKHAPLSVLADQYEIYLNEVLDAYAIGTPNEMFGDYEQSALSRFNEPNPDREAKNSRLDTFWKRSAKIVENNDYDPTKPWHSGSTTVDGEPRNVPYLIEIVFEPRQLDELRKEGEIVVCQASALEFADAGMGEHHLWHEGKVLGTVDGKIEAMLRGSVLWIAAVHRTNRWLGIGSTRMAALISLCAPQHMSQSEGRQMTDEEWRLLNQIASEKAVHGPETGWTDGGKRKAVIDMAAEENEKAYRAKYADDLTPKIARFYYIHIKTSDNRKARWHFDSKMAQNERCRMLSGLSELRNVMQGESSRDDDHNTYFVMPYTFEELTTVFGQFEELT